MPAPTTKERAKPTTHPVVRAIVADIEAEGGTLRMAEERFEFWAKRLWTRYPRSAHRELYRQIGGISLRLSRTKTLAALQCFALATLGMEADQAAQRAREEGFLQSERAKRMRNLARNMAAAAVIAPFPEAGAMTSVRTSASRVPVTGWADKSSSKSEPLRAPQPRAGASDATSPRSVTAPVTTPEATRVTAPVKARRKTVPVALQDAASVTAQDAGPDVTRVAAPAAPPDVTRVTAPVAAPDATRIAAPVAPPAGMTPSQPRPALQVSSTSGRAKPTAEVPVTAPVVPERAPRQELPKPAPAALEASDNEVTEVTRPSRPAPRANRQPMASTAQAMEHLARHKPPLPIPMSDAKTGLQGGVVISGVSHVEFGPKRNRRPRRLGNEATLRSEYRPRSPREVRDRRAMEQQPERRGIERRRLTCRRVKQVPLPAGMPERRRRNRRRAKVDAR